MQILCRDELYKRRRGFGAGNQNAGAQGQNNADEMTDISGAQLDQIAENVDFEKFKIHDALSYQK